MIIQGVIDTLVHTPSADLITMNVQTETYFSIFWQAYVSLFFPFWD